MAVERTDYDDEPRSGVTAREAVGVFNDVGTLERAIEEMMTSGFEHGDISLLARDEVVEEKFGQNYQNIRNHADDSSAPRMAYAGPEERTEGRSALAAVMGYIGALTFGGVTFFTGGAAAVALAVGAIGGGAMAGLGLALGKVLDSKIADNLHKQLERGGILVWVRLRDDTAAERAVAVFKKYGAEDIHVHDLPQGVESAADEVQNQTQGKT
ncbi:hypothetical protein [Telmatospirillum sp. J64-1]|uniref:hypothetical protein n=1 Tax=Telmatospirillum sp. J64-1 TaxID=2502183 RepID=UPI00115F77FC|nr:hypothetical protein [Telmatospirillum sp. J64-1]